MNIMDSDVLLAMIGSENGEIEEWVKQLSGKPHTSALAVAEVYAAIRRAPDTLFREARYRALQGALDGILHRRVLPFDQNAARELASLALTPHPDGGTFALATLIPSATARVLGMKIATARPEDFLGIDVELEVLTLGS
ncbi:PIN domain-containing protein [Arthrobacter sp. 35/47]|uniref:type II toxin-antitoxin system VapC family toxin n=1 Tax=Arthrobacter sp. 35/47 TaxID=269454 RepID=UPI00047BE5EF|nr:PIN domain-containing protein [Arthrobacter sp. 35/47]